MGTLTIIGLMVRHRRANLHEWLAARNRVMSTGLMIGKKSARVPCPTRECDMGNTTTIPPGLCQERFFRHNPHKGMGRRAKVDFTTDKLRAGLFGRRRGQQRKPPASPNKDHMSLS